MLLSQRAVVGGARITSFASTAAGFAKRAFAGTQILGRGEAGAGGGGGVPRLQVRCKSKLSEGQSMTLHHIPANDLHVSTPTWWLESRFHFSFADHYDPKKLQYGVLRVLNDDLVKPHSGFGTHPHRDMEIVTYIVDGKLTHKDSMGTAESLGRGSVQYMSAGTGVTHSELNNDDKLLRFLQIWILPKSRGLSPNYGSRVWSKKDRHNKLQHLVTDFAKVESDKDAGSGVIPIHQDANFYASEMDPGVSQTFALQKRRQAYLVNIEGSLSVDGVTLPARDAIEIRGDKTSDTQVQLKADESKGAHFLLIEMPLA